MQRNEHIRVYVNPDEKDLIQNKAERAGLPVSIYCRKKILKGENNE